MKKHFLIAATAVALLIPAASIAASSEAAEAFSGSPRISSEDAEAFAEAHIAGLKAGLKLSPSQEKNWPALETALRELAKARHARLEEMREQALQRVTHPDAIAALRQGAKMFSARASDLEKLPTPQSLFMRASTMRKSAASLYCCARRLVTARSMLLPSCVSFTDMDPSIPNWASSNMMANLWPGMPWP